MVERQNNYAFIDSQNVNLAIRDQGWVLDFARFRIYLRDKYDITKAFLFIGYVTANQSLYTFLGKAGYTIIYKPTLMNKNGVVKGNIDAELVLQTMIEYDHYDQAVIVTGDGDFYCLVEYLIEHRKLKRLLIPNYHKYSSLFRKFVYKVDFMNNLRDLLGNKKSP